ncbi:hypothetical protein GCM10011340_32150 [Roseivirga thermotolerans]|uniref:Uncharacterized protein n=1 Tax=Roseivirga thermotolerans TaxID=1758176 RepID=A0ABQ3IDY9_9BACT|nr:hypothetical protein GCM10011340_32150 [Roseivirga thermotolerans]
MDKITPKYIAWKFGCSVRTAQRKVQQWRDSMGIKYGYPTEQNLKDFGII